MYQLTADAPLIQHNGQTADPLNDYARSIKEISSKRKKTDADFHQMAQLEFMAGLYLNDNGPTIPANVINAVIIGAAKKFREGPTAKAAVFCFEDAYLNYDGPRDRNALWADKRFRFSAIVRVRSSRITRMRPIFHNWSAVISIQVEDTLVNPSRVDEWMEVAGTQVGIGDWRPQYGRFTAERLNGE